MTLVISKMKSQFNNKKNQVLVTHFAVSPHKEEIVLTSETSSKVGGLSTLNVSQFADFDLPKIKFAQMHIFVLPIKKNH